MEEKLEQKGCDDQSYPRHDELLKTTIQGKVDAKPIHEQLEWDV